MFQVAGESYYCPCWGKGQAQENIFQIFENKFVGKNFLTVHLSRTKPGHMGAIHDMDNTDKNRTRTIKEWAIEAGLNPDTARRVVSRNADKTLGQKSILTADEWEIWKPGKSGTKTMPDKQETAKRVTTTPVVRKDVPPEPKPEPKPAPPKPSFEWEFWAINFLEMTLIVIGLARLYEWPGLFLAAMCCLFIFKTLKLARKPQHSEAIKSALSVVLIMCVASGALHLVTFWNALKINTKTFNDESEVVTDYWLLLLKIASAVLPAVFVAYISFNAVKTTAKIHVQK